MVVRGVFSNQVLHNYTILLPNSMNPVLSLEHDLYTTTFLYILAIIVSKKLVFLMI